MMHKDELYQNAKRKQNCGTAIKQNSNIYTPILVYYVTKRMVYLLPKVQNLGRYAQSYTLFISISFQLYSNALSYQLQ